MKTSSGRLQPTRSPSRLSGRILIFGTLKDNISLAHKAYQLSSSVRYPLPFPGLFLEALIALITAQVAP